MTGRSLLIAVLDDEAEMRTALSRLLRARGFQVAPLASGAEYFAAAASAAFACIVLDLHMPGMSGFEVLGELAARKAHPPVVVITAHDAPGNRERVHALGAAEYLLKPVDQAVLFAAIARATHTDAPPGDAS